MTPFGVTLSPTMYSLHCTRKLLCRLKSEATPATEFSSDSAFGNWYATALFWKPQAALFVSERTLLPVLMPLAPAATLTGRFPRELARLLQALNMSDELIERELAFMDRCVIAKTASRSLLGMLNEFSFLAASYREGFGITDMFVSTLKLADTPCGPLKGKSPVRVLRESISGGTPGMGE